VAGHQHIQPNQLPFRYALGLLDVVERIAREVSSPIRIDLAELTIFALDHLFTPIWIALRTLAATRPKAGIRLRTLFAVRLPALLLTSEFLFFALQSIYGIIYFFYLEVLCDKDF
jgi:hypothetical protein